MSGTSAPDPCCGPFIVEVQAPDDLPAYVEIEVTTDPDVVHVVERGDIGATGADGKDGLPGPPGPGLSTTIIMQAQPAVVWTLAHGLGRYPSVTVIDTAGDQVLAAPAYVDADTVTLAFAAPTAGVAYLN